MPAKRPPAQSYDGLPLRKVVAFILQERFVGEAGETYPLWEQTANHLIGRLEQEGYKIEKPT